MADTQSASPPAAPHKKFWNRERLLSLGTAVIMTIALPISIDQGYFRYDAYVLPILGLAAAILYIVFFLTIPAVKGYGQQIHVVNRRFGKVLGILLLVLLLGGLTMGFRAALSVSKKHVEEAREADAAARVLQSAAPSPFGPTTPSSVSQPPKAMHPAKQGEGNPPPINKRPTSSPPLATQPAQPSPAQPTATPAQLPSTPTPVTNNCPNGICISGGVVEHPEVHNYGTPAPPKILGLSQQYLAPVPPFTVPFNAPGRMQAAMQYNDSLGFEKDHKEMTSTPGLALTFHVSSPFVAPVFHVHCGHCVTTSTSVHGSDGVGSWWATGGLPQVLAPGVEVVITIRSTDQTPVTDITVEPYIQLTQQ
jgi:hypothetical protein